MEIKLNGIALNHFKNHIGDITTDKGVQVGTFLLKSTWYFLIDVGIVFAQTNPCNFAVMPWRSHYNT